MQSDVRVCIFSDAISQPKKAGRGATFNLWNDLVPLGGLKITFIRGKGSFDRDRRCVVTSEKRSVNFSASDVGTAYTKLENDPVRRCSIVPSGLPAIIPSSGGLELLLIYRFSGLDKVTSLSKPLVAGADDFAT
jgi:hypothetical protein